LAKTRRFRKMMPYYLPSKTKEYLIPVKEEEVIGPKCCPVIEETETECPELQPMFEEMIECPKEEAEEEFDDCCYTDPALDYLREALAGELAAVNYYQQLILQIPDCNVQKIICEVMNDEKFHVAKSLYLLAKYDPVQNEELEAVGWGGENEYHTYHRHQNMNPNNPAQMINYLMQHLLKKIRNCVAEYLDKYLEEAILADIYGKIPIYMKEYLTEHLTEDDPLCQMPPQMREELIHHVMHYLPENIGNSLIPYVMDCCAKHLEQLAHEQGPIPGPMAGQIMNHCHTAIAECICYYLLDYFLDYLEEESAEEAETEEAETEEAEYEEECPKGAGHSQVCDVCPPWLPLIRQAMIDELKAISQYREFIAKIPYPDIQEALCAAMNTEKEHVALMAKILRMCDYSQAEEFAQFGWEMPLSPY